MSAVEATSLDIACIGCTGVVAYRVRVTNPNGHPDDNFDQLIDHESVLASDAFLSMKTTAGPGAGSITVWRLAPTGAPLEHRLRDAVVIAYAGPDPATGARSWWSETNRDGGEWDG